MIYTVLIEETLSKTVRVIADSEFDAKCIVEHKWKEGDIILDADCYIGGTPGLTILPPQPDDDEIEVINEDDQEDDEESR